MTSKCLKYLIINCVFICILISCTNINEVYNKRFNFYSFYEDLTTIENSGILRKQDAELLKLYIDHKILKDSVQWLKTQTYYQLFGFASEQASNGSSNSILDLSWKTNNSIHITLSSFNFENGDINLKIQNMSGKDIKYFRSLIKFENNLSEKLGQMDLIFNDTIVAGNTKYFAYNDKVVYILENVKPSELTVIPIIRRVVFVDSTEYVNPLSSFFE